MGERLFSLGCDNQILGFGSGSVQKNEIGAELDVAVLELEREEVCELGPATEDLEE